MIIYATTKVLIIYVVLVALNLQSFSCNQVEFYNI